MTTDASTDVMCQTDEVQLPPVLTIKDVPGSILYRHQRAYQKKRLATDQEYRAKERARLLNYYHERKSDEGYMERKREQSKAYYHRKKNAAQTADIARIDI